MTYLNMRVMKLQPCDRLDILAMNEVHKAYFVDLGCGSVWRNIELRHQDDVIHTQQLSERQIRGGGKVTCVRKNMKECTMNVEGVFFKQPMQCIVDNPLSLEKF